MDLLALYWIPVFAYLLGSIPWGYIFVRRSVRMDIRKSGSGNIGATNVGRIAGNRLAVLTLGADLLKGALPVWIAARAAEPAGADVFTALVALSAILGHLFPIYFGMKNGGKGVATAAGCFLVLAPSAAGLAILVFGIVLLFGNRVSLGSLSAAAALPFAVWITTRSMPIAGCALISACLIFFRHKENIKRLRSRKEPMFRTRK